MRKRNLSFVLLLILSLVLAACTGASAPTESAPAEEASSEQAAESTEAEAPADEEAMEESEEAMEETESAAAEPSGEPIRIGGTLALTGFLAPTAAIHKVIGDEFVKKLNAEGGLLGRPVEWVLFDDESAPDKAGALYERLITEEEVDLLIGPYGTGTITAGMNVAERYGYVFPHHTASLTYAYTYDKHFPLWYTGLHPNITTSNLLFDALESAENQPETIGFVVNQFPGSKFMAYGQEGTDEGGAVQVAEERGYEVVLDVDFPTAINDWGPIAAQVRDADPDFIYLAGLGLNANGLLEALQALDYQPRGLFVLWPAPGPLLGLGDVAEGVLSVTLFEEHEPFLSNSGAQEMIDAFHAGGTEAGLSYVQVETQASVSWAAWQVLTTAVEETGSLDQDVLADWLHNNTVDTVIGPVSFDANNQNYGPDLQKIKQIQNGEWPVVYPPEFAKEGTSLVYPSSEIPEAGSSEEAMDDSEAMDESEAMEPSGEPIVIGGTLGLTGAFAGPSADYKLAYDLWLEQINAKGGLLGRPVEMIIYDDESTPATAQALYQRLINEDGVDLILAPYTTFIGGGIIPIAEANNMVLWNGGFVGIELFKNSDWVVGGYTYQEPDYPRSVFELIDSLPEDQRPTRVGIATAQNPFTLVVRDGYDGYGGVLNWAEERGMEVVVNEEYPGNANDLSGIIQQARAGDVDLFFALSLPNDAFLLARTANELGFKPDIYCSCGSQVTTLPAWPDLGEAGEGVMATAMAWPDDNYPGLDGLWNFFQSEKGYDTMPAYGGVAYGILQVMEQAVEGAGTLDQQALRDYVTNRTFETANGPMAYDEDRIPAYNAILTQFVGGENKVVWPPDRATADPVIPMP